MLLIDGVRYQEWTPEKEVEEFHPLVKEHIQEIVGRKCRYVEGSRLQSGAGKGSQPDGFALVFGDTPEWHIVEMELSSHRLYDHIVNQVGRFINGIDNSRKSIIEAIYREITEDEVIRAQMEEVIGSGEVYKFISDLVSKPPILTIIIEKKTTELEEALNLLKYSPIKIVEFQTFRREGAEAVHAHLFESLYTVSPHTPPPVKSERAITSTPPENSVEITIQPSYLKSYYITIPAAKEDFFPRSKTPLEFDTDKGVFEFRFYIYAQWGQWIAGSNVKEWFQAHPELKAGDKIRISVIEPMKRYRLEIVK